MIHRLIIISAICLALNACGEKEPPQNAGDDADVIQPDTLAPPREAVFMVDKSFVKHMHLHAQQLDKLRAALDRGDLWEAMTPAFWLSRHDTIEGFPSEWQPYATDMRRAAFAVESAGDLETARRAAAQIVDSCNSCHAEAGVDPVQ